MTYLQRGYWYEWNGSGQIKPGGPKHYPVHQRVWEEEHGPIPDGMLVHHVNENRDDNRVENLALVSREQHPTLHRTCSTETHRRCGRCHEWKPLAEYWRNQKRCKPCAMEAQRQRRAGTVE